MRGSRILLCLVIVMVAAGCGQDDRRLAEGEALYQQERYKEALAVFDEVVRFTAKNGLDEVRCRALFCMGEVLFRMDRYFEAEEALENAEFIYTEIGDKKGRARCLALLGKTAFKDGRLRRSMELAHRALQIDRMLGNHREAADDLILLANTSLMLDDFRRAEESYIDAKNLAEDNGFEKQLAHSCLGLGIIYSDLGEFEKARGFFERSLIGYSKIGYRLGEAKTYHNLGLAYRRMAGVSDSSLYDQALQYLLRSLDLRREIDDRDGEGLTLNSISTIYFLQGKFDLAEEALREGLRIHEEIPFYRGIALAHLELGEIALITGDRDEAVGHYNKAERMADEMELHSLRWKVFLKQGEYLQSEGELGAALEKYNAAIEVIEDVRNRLVIKEQKSGYIEDKIVVYERVIEILLKQKRFEEAFDYIERAKSRSFLDMIGSRLDLYQTEDRELQIGLAGCEERLKKLRHNIAFEMKRVPANRDPHMEEWKSKSKEISDKKTEALREIERRNLSRKPLIRPSISLQTIRGSLDSRIGVVEYFLLPKAVVLTYLSADDFLMKVIEIDRDVLSQRVEALNGLVAKRDQSPEFEVYEDQIEELSHLLIRPLSGILDSCDVDVLYIIPHLFLHHFPFQILRYDEKYMVEKYNICYAPSSSLLGTFLERDNKNLSLTDGMLIGYNSNDNQNGLNPEKVIIERIGFPTLAYERESRIKEVMSSRAIIHFAVHGWFDSYNPMFSYLEMKGDKEEDGLLEAYEVFDLDLDASLVVMSACDSGLGKVSRGDENIGLTWAFLYAGANSVVSTLWKVDSMGTAEFMKTFYQYLDGHPKSEAIRLAQIDFIQGEKGKERYRHPYYWAPFMLSGLWI
ncbi:CHAT domain-containing protein [Thermodesulfobacteriota bacterium]